MTDVIVRSVIQNRYSALAGSTMYDRTGVDWRNISSCAIIRNHGTWLLAYIHCSPGADRFADNGHFGHEARAWIWLSKYEIALGALPWRRALHWAVFLRLILNAKLCSSILRWLGEVMKIYDTTSYDRAFAVHCETYRGFVTIERKCIRAHQHTPIFPLRIQPKTTRTRWHKLTTPVRCYSASCLLGDGQRDLWNNKYTIRSVQCILFVLYYPHSLRIAVERSAIAYASQAVVLSAHCDLHIHAQKGVELIAHCYTTTLRTTKKKKKSNEIFAHCSLTNSITFSRLLHGAMVVMTSNTPPRLMWIIITVIIHFNSVSSCDKLPRSFYFVGKSMPTDTVFWNRNLIFSQSNE